MHKPDRYPLPNRRGAVARRDRGFTLIELMIAVVIVGILAAIAFPSYKDHVYKSRRSTAKAALMDLAARQEQYLQNYKQYAGAIADLNAPTTTEGGFYGLTVTGALDPSGTTVIGYPLTATPAGDQVNDTKCATLTLTSRGVKNVTGTAGVAACW